MIAFQRAYASGVEPQTVQYVECHASGTPLGDKTELGSMDEFFGAAGGKPLIGSVKANHGHLLTVAGLANLVIATSSSWFVVGAMMIALSAVVVLGAVAESARAGTERWVTSILPGGHAIRTGLPLDAEAALIVELDGPKPECEARFDGVVELCHRNGATDVHVAANEEERQLIWKGRKTAFAAMGRIAPNYYVQDSVIPRTQLPQILKQSGMDFYIFMRPGPHEKGLPGRLFWWESDDGSRVLAFREWMLEAIERG